MPGRSAINENVARVAPAGAPSIWLRVGYWVCIVIAVAVVVRRMLALAYPPRSAPPQVAGLDAVFGSHAALTLAHILTALAFVLITPFVVFRSWGKVRGPSSCYFRWGPWSDLPPTR